ncbi:sucrose phosphorylase (plasmid) [Lactiplantibacillus plantarum]|uniref:sucrose phosphorylase n=1 Tax=Lactobacillaceae TaxID=33958 RepID=UPI0021A8F2FD|nr:sucrose phosphorylase [Levilactobacillus brevis]MCT3598086.1 sucrose phosphorylase [Levilactobacillus brevis]
MKLDNKAMLITYPNRLGKNLTELNQILQQYMCGVFGSVHILPFYPSSGDDGFAPIDYAEVDDQMGNWENIEVLGRKYQVMSDIMVNHLSPKSKYFQDYLEKHNDSIYHDMFLNYDKFWPKGRPTKDDIDLIYKRKDQAPFQSITFKDGKTENLWDTFSDQQIDLNLQSQVTINFIENCFKELSSHGIKIIRLDAFAYAVKKLNTNDFFVEPDIWNLLKLLNKFAQKYDTLILPEIHEHYSIMRKMQQHGYYTYDFALPIITLFTLYSKTSQRLVDWFNNSPMHQFTTLDTHDGIGVVDAKDILTDTELNETVDALYKHGANVKRAYSSEQYHNLDIYQLNTTYYSALGDDDQRYLMARLLQIFAPGIPQIYYVGLLAGSNDLDLLEKTKEGRTINRHYYTKNEVACAIQRPVVKKLMTLLKIRNTNPAFDLGGVCVAKVTGENSLTVLRQDQNGKHQLQLEMNLSTGKSKILQLQTQEVLFEI